MENNSFLYLQIITLSILSMIPMYYLFNKLDFYLGKRFKENLLLKNIDHRGPHREVSIEMLGQRPFEKKIHRNHSWIYNFEINGKTIKYYSDKQLNVKLKDTVEVEYRKGYFFNKYYITKVVKLPLP